MVVFLNKCDAVEDQELIDLVEMVKHTARDAVKHAHVDRTR